MNTKDEPGAKPPDVCSDADLSDNQSLDTQNDAEEIQPADGANGEKPDPKTESFLARTILQPSFQSAVTIQNCNDADDIGLMRLSSALAEQIAAVNSGSIDRPVAMLTAQAHTLDSIFHNLARRALNAKYVESMEAYMRLALRTQKQCQNTLETIAAVKNPPIRGVVHQANIANGPQQVNNGGSGEPAPTEPQKQKPPDKLMEQIDAQRLDTGTTSEAAAENPAVKNQPG